MDQALFTGHTEICLITQIQGLSPVGAATQRDGKWDVVMGPVWLGRRLDVARQLWRILGLAGSSLYRSSNETSEYSIFSCGSSGSLLN